MNNQQQYDLIVRAQAGDSDAMESLFSEYYNNVYYFALKTVKDPDLACDITQETFVEIMQTIGNLKEPAAFMTWMKQITYHQCTRYFRKKKDVLLDEDEDEEGNSLFDTLADEGAVPQEILEKEEFRQTILGMINELSEEQRSAVLLYYFDEMSVTQIAQVQNVSEGTVKSRLNYARKAIKKSVEGYEQKNGIKLHSVAILPLLMLYFGKEIMPAAKAAQIHAAVMGSVGTATVATGAAATTATAGAAAATTATATATAATTAAVTTGTAAAATAAGGALAAKITAGVLAAALAVGGAGVATGIIPTPWTTEETEPTVQTEGTEPTAQPQPVDYSSDLLAPLGESREFQESFADYPSNRVTYYLTKGGKLATRKAPHTEVDFGGADIRETLLVSQFPVGKDAQNVYYMHTGTDALPLTGMTGTPVAIIPVGQQNVLSYYAVISLSQGQLYYNHYSPAGQKIDYDNVPVYIYDRTDQGNALKKISWFAEIMNPVGAQNAWSFRFIADGRVYEMASFSPRISQESAACLADAAGVTENDLLSTEGNPSLIYKTASAICVDGISIALPEGKTADSVSYAVGVQTGLVFFTDGSVYDYDQTGMTLNAELTELNQKGAIHKVFTAYTSDQNIFLVMDNNMTYVLQ
jgi:RNA polymerase sigma factor (sigma-70 family)